MKKYKNESRDHVKMEINLYFQHRDRYSRMHGSLALIEIRTHNISGNRHWLHRQLRVQLQYDHGHGGPFTINRDIGIFLLKHRYCEALKLLIDESWRHNNGITQLCLEILEFDKTWPGFPTSYVKVFVVFREFTKMRLDCSFCWYWWNWWPSLFKLSQLIVNTIYYI
jgi:hypothetical protein